jgi:hypothetical protein
LRCHVRVRTARPKLLRCTCRSAAGK